MGVLRAEQLPFFYLIDVLHNRKSCRLYYHLCIGCWWAGYFASRSGAGVLLQSCFDGLGVSLVDRRLRWPANLVLKYGGPITFDSRSRVSTLVQV
jgi:hypothetical protein